MKLILALKGDEKDSREETSKNCARDTMILYSIWEFNVNFKDSQDDESLRVTWTKKGVIKRTATNFTRTPFSLGTFKLIKSFEREARKIAKRKFPILETIDRVTQQSLWREENFCFSIKLQFVVKLFIDYKLNCVFPLVTGSSKLPLWCVKREFFSISHKSCQWWKPQMAKAT